MADRRDLDKDGDLDIKVKGKVDERGQSTITALESLCSSEPGFMPKLEDVCSRLGTKTEWLVNVMMMESSLDPARKNPSSTATGLIQFMAATARALGTTTAALRRMSATRQLDYVEAYFRDFAGSLSSQAAVYAAVGAGRVGNDGSVMFKKGQKGYAANKVWDVNKDGKVTQGEMGKIAARFGAGDQFDLDDEAGDGVGFGEGGVAEPPHRERGERLAGHLINSPVGAGGANVETDVEAVQTALTAHGFSPGKIDKVAGGNTIAAIRRFQRGFMKNPDGLVEVGKMTEQHLISGSPPRVPTEEREPEGESWESVGAAEMEDVSARGAAQMQKLESTADNVAGRRPGGMCYRAVKHHITNAGGYGNIKNIYTDRRFAGAQGEARMFADVVNSNPAGFGLERLSISNPYEAPDGALIVVAAGSPGTHHPTAGDISVKGPGEAFYNDGNMSYRGRQAWPPRRGGVLGVYRPK